MQFYIEELYEKMSSHFSFGASLNYESVKLSTFRSHYTYCELSPKVFPLLKANSVNLN
jgi:hypothetical protein